MKKIFLSKSVTQTKKIGERLAKKMSKKGLKEALVIGLEGDLGGGKTTFLQGFARGLGIKEKILSPSFIIMRKFNLKSKNLSFKHFYHFDCYRIEKPKEVLELGFREIIKDPKNIVVIEWSDKIKKILPKPTIKIKFKFLDQNTRELVVEGKINS